MFFKNNVQCCHVCDEMSGLICYYVSKLLQNFQTVNCQYIQKSKNCCDPSPIFSCMGIYSEKIWLNIYLTGFLFYKSSQQVLSVSFSSLFILFMALSILVSVSVSASGPNKYNLSHRVTLLLKYTS